MLPLLVSKLCVLVQTWQWADIEIEWKMIGNLESEFVGSWWLSAGNFYSSGWRLEIVVLPYAFYYLHTLAMLMDRFQYVLLLAALLVLLPLHLFR